MSMSELGPPPLKRRTSEEGNIKKIAYYPTVDLMPGSHRSNLLVQSSNSKVNADNTEPLISDYPFPLWISSFQIPYIKKTDLSARRETEK